MARIQQAIDPTSKVEHDVVLEDRVGNKRQYDVVIRGSFAGQPVLGVSSQALKLAAHEHIGCFSLVPETTESPNLEMGDFWYGVIKKWTFVQLFLTYAEGSTTMAAGFDSNAVRMNGKSLMNWFLQELFTTYSDEESPGTHQLKFRFATPQTVNIGDDQCQLTSIAALATRINQKKRRWVHWTGVGLYDWHGRGIISPAGTAVTSSAVETDLSLWPDYDGEMPSADYARGDGARGRMLIIMQDGPQRQLPEALATDVCDLHGLGTVSYDEDSA